MVNLCILGDCSLYFGRILVLRERIYKIKIRGLKVLLFLKIDVLRFNYFIIL